MKIRMIKTWSSPQGTFMKNKTYAVSDHQGKDLIQAGAAVLLEPDLRPEPESETPRVAETAALDPAPEKAVAPLPVKKSIKRPAKKTKSKK